MYSIERARQVRELELFLYSKRYEEGKPDDKRSTYDKRDTDDLGESIETIEVDLKTGKVRIF